MGVKSAIWFIIRLQLLCISGFAVWLVLYQPPHVDEAITYRHFVSQGWKIAVSTYPFPNNHVLFSLLATCFNNLTINPFTGMRLVSLISGILNGIFIFRILRIRTTKEWSLIGVLLWGTSFIGLLYSTQARGYGLQQTFLLTALYAVLQLENVNTKSNHLRELVFWFVFAVSCALGFFTIPTFLFPGISLASLLLLGLVNHKERPFPWIRVCFFGGLSVVAILLLYTPIFIYAGVDSLVDNQWVNERKLINLESVQISAFFKDLIVYLGPALICCLGLFFLKRETRQSITGKWLLPIFFVVPLIYMLVTASLPYPRTFGYVTGIISIAIVWRVGSFSTSVKEGWKVLFVLLTTSGLVYTTIKLFPKTNNPSTIVLQMLRDPVVAEIDTIYTDGWTECGHLLDFNSWHQGSGPAVQKIWTNDFNAWLKTHRGVYVLSGTKKDCVQIVEFENQTIYYCD